MEYTTQTANPYASAQKVDVLSGEIESQALAALLSSRGVAVRLSQASAAVPGQLIIRGEGISYKAGRLSFGQLDASGMLYSSSDLLIFYGKDGDYPKVINRVADRVSPGQTVFVVDAPLGAAFELSCLLLKKRKRMALNIIETGPLFEDCHFEGNSLEISGLKEQVLICGRTVNETRCGLDLGRQLFNNLVPASNILERGLSEYSAILRSVTRLFHIERLKSGLSLGMLTSDEEEALSAMYSELQILGKAYRVALPGRPALSLAFSEHLEREKQLLSTSICETFVLLSELAAVACVQLPFIDSLIDRSSRIVGRDLRREARTLNDLGLSGVDSREIIELVNS